ncbi:PleD family two-component system response regulator [Ohtaekwangia kribbensis]|jgi:DNA-binding response OmpR family regulator|uniref:PleD family two-component system response regulator n=1 Tax=Ohtaekwangia kribbensis TaxID=688913 RepID=A0ABW3K155_9BACT
MKILVCDDDDVVLGIIKLTLQNAGMEPYLAGDGREALRHLREHEHFDLIITDIHMPYHNGDEILKMVREEQQKNTPIIMLSSDGEEEVIALALKLGVNEFITKPLDPAKLLKKIKKLVK